MATYAISAGDFFASESAGAYASGAARERCRTPMGELIARYGLAGRSVVSVGASGGHEEYWFHAAGCPLTLVDLDEDGALEPHLARLAEHAGDGPRDLTYVIEDAIAWARTGPEPSHLLYLSSFTPEELRRREVNAEGAAEPGALRRKAIGGINYAAARTLKRRLLPGVRTWPNDAPAFGEPMQALATGLVAPGGLFAYQSYATPVDLLDNPHLVGLTRSQLADWGFQLLALYAFVPWWSATTLTVAFRGTPAEAAEYRREIAANPELTEFHGRSEVPHSVRVFR